MRKMSTLLILLFVAGSGVGAAQTGSALSERADKLFQAQDWTGAANAYAEVIKADPESAQAHFRLAVALMSLDRFSDARPLLEKAERLGTPPLQVALRLAMIHAHADNRDGAFRELARATSLGLGTLPPPFDADPGLARLRSDSRFADFLTAMDRNARPCEYDPKYKELDFWLGEWDVRGINAPPNTPPSSSVIQKVHSGCVVLETWTSFGLSGQSFNIFDRSRGKWHQAWVDSSGGLHEYWGELKDGNMVYEGNLPPAPGQTGRQHTRMTFFNLGPDKVRQFSERTADSGKTWQVNYDLIYTKRK